MKNKQTDLYRYFDKDDALLYVGISISALARLTQHRVTSHWYQDAVKVTIERFENRRLALIAEEKAIKSENPRFNVVHNFNADSVNQEFSDKNLPSKTSSIDRMNSLKRLVLYKPLYTHKEVAEILYNNPASSRKVRDLIEDRKLQGICVSSIDQKSAQGQMINIKKYVITGWQLIEFIEALEAGEVTL